MTIEEPEPTSSSDQILEWLDTIDDSFLSSFFVEPYTSNQIDTDQWLVQAQDADPTTITTATITTPPDPITLSNPQPSNSFKKRKSSDHHVPKTSRNRGKNGNCRRINEADDGAVEHEMTVKKSGGAKRASAKSTGNNCNNREGRWAEQLLNPCAAAITAENLPRVQHLLYVLHELASPTGDANHRLAAHGLRALTHHLSPASSVSSGAINFASSNPQLVRKSLIRFDEVSPWFMIPNKIANNSILQILSDQYRSSNLHIVDIGVSHGVQWPTLLEALTRRPGGPPPLVRLTVVGASSSDCDGSKGIPFAIAPPGCSYSSRLLCFAKSININLQINRIDNHQLQNLNAEILNSSPNETLIICAQFRLHHLNHNNPDNRSEFLQVLRSLDPKGVILSENNKDCSCSKCGDFATSFSRRVEYLWRFLDSTSAAFKGRESEERRVMEGEAAKMLTNLDEMNEGQEKWCERMRRVGFVEEVFAEDTIDETQALLRKYDSNWEMRMEEKDGCLGLWWKGQPVSFCSLWK